MLPRTSEPFHHRTHGEEAKNDELKEEAPNTQMTEVLKPTALKDDTSPKIDDSLKNDILQKYLNPSSEGAKHTEEENRNNKKYPELEDLIAHQLEQLENEGRLRKHKVQKTIQDTNIDDPPLEPSLDDDDPYCGLIKPREFNNYKAGNDNGIASNDDNKK